MAKNKTNAIMKTGMAAVLATSALVPAAVASAATPATEISEVIFTYNNQLVSLSLNDYVIANLQNELDGTQPIDYIKGNNGEYYSLNDYVVAITQANGDSTEAFKELEAEGSAVKDVQIKEGTIENGKVVADETLEEKVNETFFYNLAA